MIEVDKINKSYGKIKVLENISFDLENGKIFALVGANGAGKTTLLNAISSNIFKDNGSVKIDGIDNGNFNSKYNLFYVTDNKEAFLNYTINEYIIFIENIYQVEIEKEIVRLYIERLQLNRHMNKYIDECSFGTKQKVFLLGALISNCRNLILDEPFNGLDPFASETLRKILKETAKAGKMILYSTHNLDTISNYSDVILFLGNRKVFRCNNKNETYESVYRKFLDICR